MKDMFVPLLTLSRLEFSNIPEGLKTKEKLRGVEEFKPVYEGLKSDAPYESRLDDSAIGHDHYHLLFRNGAAYFGLPMVGMAQVDRQINPTRPIYWLQAILSFVYGIYIRVGYGGPLDMLVMIEALGPLNLTVADTELDLLLSRHKFTTDTFEHRFTTNIGEINESIPKVIHDLMDHFWQSFGRPQCDAYGDNHTYSPLHIPVGST